MLGKYIVKPQKGNYGLGYYVKNTRPYGLGAEATTPSTSSSWADVTKNLFSLWGGLETAKLSREAEVAKAEADQAKAEAEARAAIARAQSGGGMSMSTAKTLGIVLGVGGVGLLAAALLMKKKKGGRKKRR